LQWREQKIPHLSYPTPQNDALQVEHVQYTSHDETQVIGSLCDQLNSQLILPEGSLMEDVGCHLTRILSGKLMDQ
jgi:hypothetical protein